jgi:glutamate 5-kinase
MGCRDLSGTWCCNLCHKFLHFSQLLLTEFDFRSQDRYHYINSTLTKLLKVGVVPILNENDAVRFDFVFHFWNVNQTYFSSSGNTGYFVRDGAFSDNDGLASLVAAQMKVQ